MAKEQMTFSLGIKTTADMTGINQLKKSLQELSTYGKDLDFVGSSGLSAEQINKSTASIRQLDRAIDSAFDVNLNGINFNTFQKNLKASGTSLNEIGKNLSALGPEGTAAFAQATSQVFKMNTAVQYTNSSITKLFDTFKNTIVYTGFNAILNTVSKTVSNAFRYIEDLDKSLNNIRIVSGQSAENMAEFADQANKAAKELGATTTAYTDAALIYYQQGLRGEEVTERTDVTQKMANVTGETAEKVSQDLTAIWNNFYDGSKSLEYYADVLTALGASTASSTDEIAAGLEKFAAISSTVGLSYEYATSALATVVAETRQSADTVGTAFKTLFARIQGLKLGDTLEDGTDLNKYSQALMAVGINIKTSNGELKEMDVILDELGAKWQQLNKDEQVALAQTVAGTRQYSQLVALMDNWDVFQKNLGTTANATGELQKQQDIYMESTAAHMKQLKAASEDLYSSLFDSKSINNWIDSFTKIIEQIDNLAEALGGLNNIAPMLMFGALNAFSGNIATTISQSIANKKANDIAISDEVAKQQYLQQNNLSENLSGQASNELERQSNFYKEMLQYESQMTKYEQDKYNNLIEAGAELVRQNALLDEQKQIWNKINHNIIKDIDFNNITDSIPKLNAGIDAFDNLLHEINIDFTNAKNGAERLGDSAFLTFKGMRDQLEKAGLNVTQIDKFFEKMTSDINNAANGEELLYDGLRKIIAPAEEAAQSMRYIRDNAESTHRAMDTMTEEQMLRTTIQNYIQLGSAVGQVAMGIQTIKNVGNIWSNDDLSTGEKILQTIINLSFAIGQLGQIGNVFSSFKDGFKNLQILLKGYADKSLKTKELNNIEQQDTQKTQETITKITKDEIEKRKDEIKKEIEEIKKENEALRKELEDSSKIAQKSNEDLKQKYVNGDIENGELTADIKNKVGNKKKYTQSIVNKDQTKYQKNNDIINFNNEFLEELEKEETESITDLEKELLDLDNIEPFEKIIKNSATATDGLKLLVKDGLGALKGKMLAPFQGVSAALQAVGLSAGAASLALGALGIVIATGFIAWQAYKKSLKDISDAAEENSTKIRKQTEIVKDNNESLNNLKNAYEELGKVQEDLTPEELRNKSYQLCLQYGQEELAIKSLSMTYEDLDKIISDTVADSNKKLAELAKNTVEAQEATVKAKIRESSKTRTDYRINANDEKVQTLDLKGMTVRNDDEYKQFKEIEELAATYGIKDLMVDLDHIDTNKFTELLGLANEEVRNILSNYETEAGNQLLQYIEENNDSIVQLGEDVKLQQEAIVKSISSNLKDNELDTDNFISTLNSIIEQLISNNVYADTEKGREEAYQRALEMIYSQGSKNAIENTQNYSLAKSISDSDSDIVKNFEKISNLSTAEKQAVGIYSEYLKTTGTSIEKFIETHQAFIKSLSYKDNFTTISAVLKAANKNGKFEQKDIDNLFADDTVMTIKVGFEISKDEFEKLTYEQQSLYSSQALITNLISGNSTARTEEDKQVLQELENDINHLTEIASGETEKLNLYKQAFQENFDLSEEEVNAMLENDEFSKQAENLDKSKSTINDYVDFLKDIGLEEEAEALAESGRGLINTETDTLEQLYKIIAENGTKEDLIALQEQMESLDNVFKTNVGVKTYENEINNLIEQQNNLSSSTIDVKELNSQVEEQYKTINTTIDYLKSQYSSLKSVVDDYNDNQKLSLDSIEKLITLDNDFVASLEFEGNQLKINGENYESLMDIQIAYMRQQVMNDLILDLHTIAQGEAADKSAELSNQTDNFTGSIKEATDAVAKGLPYFYDLAIAEAAIANQDISGKSNEIEKAVQAAYNKLKLINSVDYTATNKKSSSSSKKDKKDKYYEDEFDRYRELKIAIEDLTRSMSRLDKIQSKLHGPELQKSLELENKLLDKRIAKNKELMEEQKKEIGEINGRLANSGFTFDETGEITNYQAQTKKLYADYQAVIDGYNAGTVTEKEYDKATQVYEKMKKDLQKHDERMKDFQDTYDKVTEDTIAKIDNNLQRWEEGIQLRLDTREAERDWRNFFDKVNDDFKSIYKNYGSSLQNKVFNSKSLGYTFNIDVEKIQKAQADIDKMMAGAEHGDVFSTVADARAHLKEYSDQMREDAEKIFDLYQEGWEDFNGYIDDAIGKFDKLTDKFERINDDLDHQGKLIELLYGENDFNNLDNLYDAQKKNYLGEMASLRDQAAFFKQQYEELVEIYGEDNEAAEKFKESWLNAVDELHSKEEEYLDTLAKRYANSINKAFSDFEKKLTDGSNFDFVSEQWDLSKKAAEGVFDEQEKIYQLQTLGNKYQEAINKASSAKSQQKLADLMASQVDSLKDKTRLTQYDVELAEKRLAVAEAEAALEDARENKNALKVTRGDDGNWSYQYVADEGDVDDKEQALLDAQYDAYEFVKQNVSDTKEALMELAKDWEDHIRDLEEKMIGATEEEKAQYQEMIDWYNNYYGEQMSIKAGELKDHEVNLAQETNALLQTEYMVNEENYQLMTDNQKALIDGLREYSIQSATDIYNGINGSMDFIAEKGDEVMRETIEYFNTAASEITDRWANEPDSVAIVMQEAMDQCHEALDLYIESVHEGTIAAGEDFTDVGTAIDADKEKTNELKDDTSELVEQADKDIHEYIGYLDELKSQWEAVKEWIDLNKAAIDEYLEKIDEIPDRVQQVIDKIDIALDKLDELDQRSGGHGIKVDDDDDEDKKGFRYSVQTDAYGVKGNYGIMGSDGQYVKITTDRDEAYRYADMMNSNSGSFRGTYGGGGMSSEAQKYLNNSLNSKAYGWTDYAVSYNSSNGVKDENGNIMVYTSSKLNAQKWIELKHQSGDTTNYIPFDTGGYTGSWNNDSGKLAMLHQKELVLNADDTDNMLKAVSAVRDLSSIQSNIQQAVADSIAKALINIAGLGGASSTYNSSTVDSSQNNVFNINADFPNANSVTDIQQAILNLPNLASQYANRKSK